MEKGRLAKTETARDNRLVDVLFPFRRRQVAVDAHARTTYRPATAEAGDGPGDGCRTGLLPRFEETPVGGAGRDQVADRAELFDLAMQCRMVGGGGVQPDGARPQPDQGHADREQKAEGPDRAGIDDPEIARDWDQLVQASSRVTGQHARAKCGR
jgi:hypothetical protein